MCQQSDGSIFWNPGKLNPHARWPDWEQITPLVASTVGRVTITWSNPPAAAVCAAATAKKPAGSSPGVLKQLQFVWGAPYCDHHCTPAAPAATAAGQTQDENPTGTIITESGSLPNAGHKRRLLQLQQQQSGSTDRMLSAQEHLQEARQRLRLAAAAAAAAAEAQQPPLLLSEPLEDITAADVTQQQQQRRRLAAAAAAEIQEPALEGLEDDAWATAELEAAAAIQQGLWGSSSSSSSDVPTPTTSSSSSSSSANSSVVVPASIHRMLSVIKPDNRLPCPVKSFPYYAMGQIKAKASDGGFVCSGGLIGSNRVLTAGHCVWDDRNAQGPFKDLRFAPGQWKVSVGACHGCSGFALWHRG